MVDFLLVYYSGIFCTWPTTGSLYIYIYTHSNMEGPCPYYPGLNGGLYCPTPEFFF